MRCGPAFRALRRTEWTSARQASPLAADFQAFGDDLIENDRFDQAADERWKRFVAGESLESMPAKSRQ